MCGCNGVALRVLPRHLRLRQRDSRAVYFLEDFHRQREPTRLKKLLPHEHVYSLEEWRRVCRLRAFRRLEESTETLSRFPTAFVELQDGSLDALFRGEVRVVVHDVLEEACDIALRAVELLGNEHGLFCEVGIDCYGAAIYSDLACREVFESRVGSVSDAYEPDSSSRCSSGLRGPTLQRLTKCGRWAMSSSKNSCSPFGRPFELNAKERMARSRETEAMVGWKRQEGEETRSAVPAAK